MSDERVDKGKAEEQDFEAHKVEIQRTDLGQVEPGQEPGRGELGRTKNDSEDDDFEGHQLGNPSVERGVVERGKAENV